MALSRVIVILAGPAHGLQTVEDSRPRWDEALRLMGHRTSRPGSVEGKDSRVPPSLSDTDAHELRVPAAGIDNAAMIPGDGIAMPIRPELRPLYPPHWRELSSHVRFKRAEGRCQRLGGHTSSSCAAYRTGAGSTRKPRHGGIVEDGLPAGRPYGGNSVSDDARRARSGAPGQRSDQQSAKNLRALCQRCHMLHDRPHHLAQRWITYRRRSAVGDLFLGPYPVMIAALTSKRTSQGSRFSGGGE